MCLPWCHKHINAFAQKNWIWHTPKISSSCPPFHPLGSGVGRSAPYCTGPTSGQKRMGGETPTRLLSHMWCEARIGRERLSARFQKSDGGRHRMKCDAKNRLLRENNKIFQSNFSMQKTAISCRNCGQYRMVVRYKIRNDFAWNKLCFLKNSWSSLKEKAAIF